MANKKVEVEVGLCRRALCSIGIVKFAFVVSTITSSRGIIENMKKGQISREGSIFLSGGWSSKKMTTIRRGGGACEKLVS